MSIYPNEPDRRNEFMRINPVLQQTMDHIKYIINEDGFYSVNEFKRTVEEKGLMENELLLWLRQEGITHVKTLAANNEYEQEVLVDIRPMAAAMLLIYSDRGFALKNSVFSFLEKLYAIAEWRGAFPVLHLNPLLKDMYETYGHNFTVSEVAEAADLSDQDETLILERAQRHTNQLRELMKSDAELTAVYELCARTMDIVNGFNINGHKATRKDLQFRQFKNPVAYNRFWTLSQNIIDRHYKKTK